MMLNKLSLCDQHGCDKYYSLCNQHGCDKYYSLCNQHGCDKYYYQHYLPTVM